MGGIVDYFHGESGMVTTRGWRFLNNGLAFGLQLTEDPHRQWTFDYDADIGVDPEIAVGDRVVYLRLDDTCGIWVRQCDDRGPDLLHAIARVKANRLWAKKCTPFVRKPNPFLEHPPATAKYLEEIEREWLDDAPDHPRSKPPYTPVRLFLSYSSTDALLAREIHDDIKNDAGADVWFDLAQLDGRAPDDQELARRLNRSVNECQGFVLILTRTAAASDWVSREITYAMKAREAAGDYHLIVLKLADVDVPVAAYQYGTVIDCDGIWWSRGISEDLFAALYRRQSRRAWIAEQNLGFRTDGVLRYADFSTESGVCRRFEWSPSPPAYPDVSRHDLEWRLEYTSRGGEEKVATGSGLLNPVDLDIRPGHRIAFINTRRRWGSTIERPLPLWMRGDDVNVSSDLALDRYYDASRVNQRLSPIEIRMGDAAGENVWGKRLMPEVDWRTPCGQWIPYSTLIWPLYRQDISAAAVNARSVGVPMTRSGSARAPVEPIGIPTPHPAADPNRAARLNIEYQHALAEWRALPWWKRLRGRTPEPPEGI